MNGKIFARRSVTAFFTVMLMLLSCIMRVAVIASSDKYKQAQLTQSRYKITVGKNRGSIYDRNRVLLTNNSVKIIAAVSPVPEAITAVSKALSGEEKERVLNILKQKKPAVCEVEREISAKGIKCFAVREDDKENAYFKHIIGYTDATDRGVSGLQMAYDGILFNENDTSAVFYLNGKGEQLSGIEPEFENTEKNSDCVITTLDLNIQKAAIEAAEDITHGAVVVCGAKTGEIYAILSKPDFDLNDVASCFDKTDSPLLNRALSAYSVGSVFKPCVAAAAFSENKENIIYECVGKAKIIDRDFNCHKRDGHGVMDLKSALENSCNTYFYNLGLSVGKQAVYNTASALNFGRPIEIADNFYTSGGSLPDLTSLDNPALLANFSIGQGYLSLSPVNMLTLYCSVANGGTYRLPRIVKSTVKNGTVKEFPVSAPTRVMSKETADFLKEALKAVVETGTGTAAKPELCTAAGKTATAQTGRYNNLGKEINNSWFCGFFPYEEPEYVAVIMSEGGTTSQTAGAFKKLADIITKSDYTVLPD